MKKLRKIIRIDENRCTGCGNCVVSCEEAAIEIIEGKAKVISEVFCDGLGACIKDCPVDALRIVEREAEAFDALAAADHLKNTNNHKQQLKENLPSGCSSNIQRSFHPDQSWNESVDQNNIYYHPSRLSNWPVQIRLISSEASFLKNAELLVASDCSSISYPDFHRDFVKGKVVMTGCPKFDQTEDYKQKFADIFTSCGIKNITILIMEVPCCGYMPEIVLEGMKRAGVHIPYEIVTLTLEGTIKERDKVCAMSG